MVSCTVGSVGDGRLHRGRRQWDLLLSSLDLLLRLRWSAWCGGKWRYLWAEAEAAHAGAYRVDRLEALRFRVEGLGYLAVCGGLVLRISLLAEEDLKKYHQCDIPQIPEIGGSISMEIWRPKVCAFIW